MEGDGLGLAGAGLPEGEGLGLTGAGFPEGEGLGLAGAGLSEGEGLGLAGVGSVVSSVPSDSAPSIPVSLVGPSVS